MSSRISKPAMVMAAAMALVIAGTGLADAKSRKKHGWKKDYWASEEARRRASEREWEHTRAKAYDPGGSYAGYPDWARYALSPKGNR